MVECVYEITVHHSKNDLRAERDRLRLRQQFFERVFAVLIQPQHCEKALSRIRSGKLEESEWVDLLSPSNNSQPMAEGRTNGTYDNPQSRVLSRASGPYSDSIADGQLKPRSIEQTSTTDGTWTCLTSDSGLIQHLLELYFCWEYPSFAPISKEHFLRDFDELRPRYCSPMLVNALLALACHLSDRPIAKQSSSLHILADDFFKESARLFTTELNLHCLTTIQALAIMSLREARCSRVSESKYYAELGMRLAIEMGLQAVTAKDHKDELAVLAKTFWGIFTLNQ